MTEAGTVVALRRYPVKSMLGEDLGSARLTASGLEGDRVAAVIDVDFAPVHLVTSATLAHVGAEMIRYRPNLVVDLPGSTAFAENDWAGREVSVGPARLRVMLPTPRCAVPTLAHGALPRRVDAVRTLLTENRVAIPDVGVKPCLGAYAQVVTGGTVSVGDRAALS